MVSTAVETWATGRPCHLPPGPAPERAHCPRHARGDVHDPHGRIPKCTFWSPPPSSAKVRPLHKPVWRGHLVASPSQAPHPKPPAHSPPDVKRTMWLYRRIRDMAAGEARSGRRVRSFKPCHRGHSIHSGQDHNAGHCDTVAQSEGDRPRAHRSRLGGHVSGLHLGAQLAGAFGLPHLKVPWRSEGREVLDRLDDDSGAGTWRGHCLAEEELTVLQALVAERPCVPRGKQGRFRYR
jgi:hypothetical protein